jgi:mycothiol synthase
VDLTTVQIGPSLRSAVESFVNTLSVSEGLEALSEHKMMRVVGSLDVRDLALRNGTGTVVGYAQAAWHGASDRSGHWAIEVATAEEYRDPETVVRFVDEIANEVGNDDVVFWSRAEYTEVVGDQPQWRETRVLLEMRQSFPIAGIDADAADLDVTTFRIGVDEERWLRLNNEVFAGHPESGNMTRRDLEKRMALPWFDPAGFFLGWLGGELVATCWTKLHEGGTGEIYIIGVDPRFTGRGYGRSMLSIGLSHLEKLQGTHEAMLYVEQENEPAQQLYESLGFTEAKAVKAYSYLGGVLG